MDAGQVIWLVIFPFPYSLLAVYWLSKPTLAPSVSALHDIRCFCRLIRAFVVKTQSHISNTQGTRTQGLFGGVKAKQAWAVSTYWAAWNAIMSLAPNEEFGCWKGTLFELKNDNIRGPGCNESEHSESHYVQSWIWTTPQSRTSIEGLDPNDPNLHVAVWIEWCKAQEWAKHYKEEVELVVEEMWQTLVTFEWNAQKWEAMALSPPPPSAHMTFDTTTLLGVAAYAYKQADIQRKMFKVFLNDWYHALEQRNLGSPWLKQYSCPPENKHHRLPSNIWLYHSGSYTPVPSQASPKTQTDD